MIARCILRAVGSVYNIRPFGWLALTLALALGSAPLVSPTPTSAAQPPLVGDTGWPRQFTREGYSITVYQPQLESWDAATKMTARAAVSRKAPGAKDPTFGVAWMSARTTVDKDNRLVELQDLTVTKVSFPSAPDQEAAFQKALQAAAPTQARYVSLDRLEAMVQAAGSSTAAAGGGAAPTTPTRRRATNSRPTHANRASSGPAPIRDRAAAVGVGAESVAKWKGTHITGNER